MTAEIIDGRALAATLREQVKAEAEAAEEAGIRVALATLRVGDDYAAELYERRLHRLAERIEMPARAIVLPEDTVVEEVMATVGMLQADPRISGILILRPLPAHIDETSLYRILSPAKDIECVTPENSGLLAQGTPLMVPSTPASCFHIIDSVARSRGLDPRTAFEGQTFVLVGRSNNVGKPAVWLGLAYNGTVTSIDVYTFKAGRLREFTSQAEVLICAAGVPGLITGDDVSPGVIAIDVGINAVVGDDGDTTLVGDFDFDSVAEKAAAITPVPGGVGPITDVWLLHNTVRAATLSHIDDPSPWEVTGLVRTQGRSRSAEAWVY